MANINNLTREIVKSIQEYTEEVKEEIEISQKEVAADLVKQLKVTSPKRPGSGKYAKGWRMKKTRTGWIVHNKTKYQLTHLLEKGHAKRNGGRVAARVHIRPAEEKAVRDYLTRVEKAIKR